jgi:predicted porin
MNRSETLRLALALAALFAANAHAQETPNVSFSGYATVGGAHSDNRDADYLTDVFKPNGPGHTHAWSWDVDSRAGVQATANLTMKLSAVLQVITQQDYRNSYRPAVEWANVKYQFTPELAARAGRVVLPVFMVTDYRRVGYANPWVRPPVELYSLVPITTIDGIDGAWRSNFGDVTNTVQATLGRADAKFGNASGFEAGTAEVRNAFAVANTIEYGAISLRLNYGQADLTVQALAPLFDAFRQFGPPGESIAQRFDVHDRKADFVGIGVNYDPGKWFVMAEAARFNTHSVLGSKRAWYASGGYRFGRFTPYVTFAQVSAGSSTTDPGLSTTGLPPEAAGTAAFLNARLNQTLGLITQQRTVSVGVRWDVLRNMALKAQYDRIRTDDGSYGTFGNVQPGFVPGTRVGVFSAVADILF